MGWDFAKLLYIDQVLNALKQQLYEFILAEDNNQNHTQKD
jgi:hypothetical protein